MSKKVFLSAGFIWCYTKSVKKMRQSKKGQIVVEYVLLLVVSVTIALLITQTMVSRNEDAPGFLIAKWRQIIEFIASDVVETP